jgi:large subunit ribosomal protein L17
MRHSKHKYHLTMDRSQRASLIKNLSVELIDHKKIKTTITKCRALKIFVEKLVTAAKKDTVANRRLVYGKINNRDAVNKLFVDIAPKFTSRPGGYTRITKLADLRAGDGSEMAYISFVD